MKNIKLNDGRNVNMDTLNMLTTDGLINDILPKVENIEDVKLVSSIIASKSRTMKKVEKPVVVDVQLEADDVKEKLKVVKKKEQYFRFFSEKYGVNNVAKAGNIIYINSKPYMTDAEVGDKLLEDEITTSTKKNEAVDYLKIFAKNINMDNIGFSFKNHNFNDYFVETQEKQFFQLPYEYKPTSLETISKDLKRLLEAFTPTVRETLEPLARVFFNNSGLGGRRAMINYYSPKSAIGKSSLVNFLASCLPNHYVYRIDDPANQLFGRFGKHYLHLKLLNYIDDDEYQWDLRAKQLITSDKLDTEVKGSNTLINVSNTGTFVLTSNSKMDWSNVDNAISNRAYDIEVLQGNKLPTKEYIKMIHSPAIKEEFVNLLFSMASELVNEDMSYWEKYFIDINEDNKIIEFLKDLVMVPSIYKGDKNYFDNYEDVETTPTREKNLLNDMINVGVNLQELQTYLIEQNVINKIDNSKRVSLFNIYLGVVDNDAARYRKLKNFNNEMSKLQIFQKRSTKKINDETKSVMKLEITDEKILDNILNELD